MTILRRTIAGLALLCAAYVAVTMANAQGATLDAGQIGPTQSTTAD